MRDAPMSILAIFAHPDDEIGSGSTLAHYTGSGVLANLVCASRGEAATIYCEDCATRENLAEVRTRELECACRNLGLAELRWLDWPDGGIAALPRYDAIRRVVAVIRQLQPDIIITHPDTGLYPHPDHLAVWEITRQAFDAAADPEQYRNVGQPWSTARLYTRVIPQSFFDAAPAFASYRVQLNGEQLPFYATPDAAVDVVMQVACCVDQRQAGWECHRSQHNPEGAFAQMPDDVRRAMWENEHYVLAASRVPLAPGERHDLLAGLDAWTAEPAPVDDYAGTLRANLAVRRAYLEICAEYERTTTQADFKAFLHTLADRQQDFIYLLARTLRRADGKPGEVGTDERVVAQGRACHGARASVQFLLIAAQHAMLRYQELAARADDTQDREDWEELQKLAQDNLKLIREFAQTT